VEHNVPRMT